MILPLATCDPALSALFTPRQPLLGRYEVCSTSEPIETAAGRDITIEGLEAPDAFGAAGPYNRSKLARLYRGTRVRVARRWTLTGGRFESITLLSPYPDASLTRLVPGTLEIRWILEP
jgi:hypothetical protein